MKYFEVTEEHIKLLRHAYVGWDDCEFGAPAIDCKRPYGNSNVIGDMVEILGLKNVRRDEDGEYKPEIEEKLYTLHKELKTALQIALSTGKFEIGAYKAADYSNQWDEIKDKA